MQVIDMRAGDSNDAEEGLIPVFRRIPIWPFVAAAILSGGAALFLGNSDACLLAWCVAAFGTNAAVCLRILRSWSGGVAVLALCLNYLLQSLSLSAMCVAGMLGYLDFYGGYTMLTERGPYVFFALTVASWAAISVFGLLRAFRKEGDSAGAEAPMTLDADPQLPAALVLAAAFSVLAWVGGSIGFGILRSFLQVLQRAFMLVPLIAGMKYRVSRLATGAWCVALLINLPIGIATGSRTPAFAPLAFFAMGLVLGATKRIRWRIIIAVAVLAVPLGYIFGIMELVRGEVGYIKASDISLDTIANVQSALKEKRPGQVDEYVSLPAWVRTSWRLVTWPTYVVAASAEPPYRGFGDLGTQIISSANIVTFSGQTDENSEEQLFNVRARDYGFRVDEGTSVEFGLVAESWDRGGPMGALAYCLVTVAVLAGLESGIRRTLIKHPAFCAVTISVVCTTAFWGLNIYNLPLSLRKMVVDLLFCVFLFAIIVASTPSAGSRPGGMPRLGRNAGPRPPIRGTAPRRPAVPE